MTVLPRPLLDSDDDWIEPLRRYWWPRLAPYWPYATITIQDDEYVCTVPLVEDALEEELVDVGFVRNPVAGLKEHADGRRVCEGSWCLLPQSDPTNHLKPTEQLHVNLFETPDDSRGLELFAHVETDWRDDPIGHLTDGTNLQRGRTILLEVLREHTFLDVRRVSRE